MRVLGDAQRMRDIVSKAPRCVLGIESGLRQEARPERFRGGVEDLRRTMQRREWDETRRGGVLADGVSLDWLLLETDCPYIGFGRDDETRAECGVPNGIDESCTLPILAEMAARLYDMDPDILVIFL